MKMRFYGKADREDIVEAAKKEANFRLPIGTSRIERKGSVLVVDTSKQIYPSLDKEEMAKIHAELVERETFLFAAGQKEYARREANVFANFNRIAENLGLSPEQVLLVYLSKHFDGVVAWVNGHRSQREDVRGRIDDMRVYLAILAAMIEAYEKEQVSEAPTQ